MPRLLKVAAAQVGRIDRNTARTEILSRLISLLEHASDQQVKLVVFPETTLTAFFPRYFIEDEAELADFFEKESPSQGIASSESVKEFFDKAKELEIDVVIGYGEATPEGQRFNTASYVSKGETVGKYR